LPRKGPHSAPLGWGEACDLLGEDNLTAGVKERTWRYWREQKKVPAYRVVEVLRARGRDISLLREGAKDGADLEWSRAVNYLRAIWHSPLPGDRVGIMLNLEAIARLAAARGPAQKKRA
jgi:hypothetical protein